MPDSKMRSIAIEKEERGDAEVVPPGPPPDEVDLVGKDVVTTAASPVIRATE